MQPNITSFFHKDTATFTYILYDRKGGAAAIIDSVLDYDPKSGQWSTQSADLLIEYVQANELQVEWLLETHAHADHLSAAPYLKEKLGGKIAIGEKITHVQKVFNKLLNLEHGFSQDGGQFDVLFQENATFQVGTIPVKVHFVPGHTPADTAFEVPGALFVGDTLFMPDVGTARCDFPGGSAHTLYDSIQKILSFPDATKLYMCHDYPPANSGRSEQSVTTVGEQKAHNIHVKKGILRDSYVEVRNKRDATLDMPRLIYPSIQVNIRAGKLPPAESNGVIYLKIPFTERKV